MKYIGECEYCGADMYRAANGKVVSKNPAPDCICELRLQDRLDEDVYGVVLSRDQVLLLLEGDSLEVEGIVEDILNQIREQTED